MMYIILFRVLKVLRKDLDKKYKIKDVNTKKFILYIILDFKIIDSRIVIKQILEFQLILHGIHIKSMYLGESFQIPTIIEKLVPS